MPDFKAQFPRWEPQSLGSILPINLSDHGKDLFKKLLIYDPAKRISAKEAYSHPYFQGKYIYVFSGLSNKVIYR